METLYNLFKGPSTDIIDILGMLGTIIFSLGLLITITRVFMGNGDMKPVLYWALALMFWDIGWFILT